MLEREHAAQAADASHIDHLLNPESSTSDFAEHDDELLELAALDLDSPNWMESLSANQLAKFHSLLASGTVDNVIHPWVPWWLRDTLTPKIQVLEDNSTDEDDGSDSASADENTLEPAPSPPLLNPIPSLASLTKIKPSPLLANNVIEVLYAYAYVKRLFNGDWDEENCLDAVDLVVATSKVLRENHVYKELQEACRTPLEATLANPESFVSAAFSTSVLNDVLLIVSHGPPFLKAALSELNATLLAALAVEQSLSPDSSSTSSPSSSRSTKRPKTKVTLSQMQKKVVFFIVWANECADELIPALELSLKALTEYYSSMTPKQTHQHQESPDILTSMTSTASSKPTENKKRPKIEELSS